MTRASAFSVFLLALIGMTNRAANNRPPATRLFLRTIVILCVCLVTLSIASQFVSTGEAQQRADEYSGVVLFDRWDSCYLVAGTHVTYIAKYAKDDLRRYRGMAIQVHATQEVSGQEGVGHNNDGNALLEGTIPHEPLIQSYKIIGPAPEPQTYVLRGLELTAEPDFEGIGVRFLLQIRNAGTSTNTIMSDYIGPLLLGPKPRNPISPSFSERDPFSNDVSNAIITHSSLLNSGGWKEENKGYATYATYTVEDGPPARLQLSPGESMKTRITLDIPPGQYQFLFGYGADNEKSSISNAISFDVNETGQSTLVK